MNRRDFFSWLRGVPLFAMAAAGPEEPEPVALAGDAFGREQVEAFVESLKEYQRDGGA